MKKYRTMGCTVLGIILIYLLGSFLWCVLPSDDDDIEPGW